MFETLKLDNNFEINSNYPHEIRNKETKEVLKVRISDYGYEIVDLPSKPYALARVIAIQWIPNPNNFKHISFIDKNKSHSYVSNIVWSKELQPWDELLNPPNHFIRYNPNTDSMEIKFNDSIILPSITPDNLLYFRSINNHKFFIHELVAQHYLTNPDSFHFIIHQDNNTLNNKPTNLRFSKYDVIPNQQEMESQPLNIKQIKKYDGDRFDNLYISNDLEHAFIKDGNKYLELQTHSSKLGKYIQTLTITNRKRRLYFSIIESKNNSSFKRFITNQNHNIDWFDVLPDNAVQIKTFNNKSLKPIYFYDSSNDLIIKQIKSKYRIIRSMTFLIEFNDGSKSYTTIKDLIHRDNSTQTTMNETIKITDDYF